MITVEELIAGRQYDLTEAAKQDALLPLLAASVDRCAEGSSAYRKFLAANRFAPSQARSVADFPPLPVAMFKEFDLRVCSESQVVRVLESSGTSGQARSRIYLDTATSHRQQRALLSILKSWLGSERRPCLIFDVPEVHDPAVGRTLAGRGAAIRGIQSFASETVYGLKSTTDGMEIDQSALDDFGTRHRHTPVLVFGFTFVLWSELIRSGYRLDLPRATVLHGGGWKKLSSESVTRRAFNEQLARALGCAVTAVRDYYGMIEQVGTIFVDCEYGLKHAPAFSTVLIRDPLTMLPCGVAQEGLIEVVSVLPSSYPGHVLLTEDQGRIIDVDGCRCGRRGVAFEFTSRVLGAELRGCGDVLAARSLEIGAGAGVSRP